jgi:glucan phosphoethanolaminetransferase (alkaline phosphatase superfamily)
MMKTFIPPVGMILVLGLIGYFGGPTAVHWSSTYLGMHVVALYSTDNTISGTSLASLLITCAVCAAVFFWLYVRVYRNSSLWVYFGSLVIALLLAAAGVWLNLYQLLALVKDNHLPTHMMLSIRDMSYFEWGMWPVVVVTVAVMAVIFLFEPGSPDDDEDDEDADENTPTENIG